MNTRNLEWLVDVDTHRRYKHVGVLPSNTSVLVLIPSHARLSQTKRNNRDKTLHLYFNKVPKSNGNSNSLIVNILKLNENYVSVLWNFKKYHVSQWIVSTTVCHPESSVNNAFKNYWRLDLIHFDNPLSLSIYIRFCSFPFVILSVIPPFRFFVPSLPLPLHD